METDFRTFFLLVKTIIKIRRNQFLKNIPTSESIFLQGETNLLASGDHFFLHFSETLGSDSFFPV